MKHLILSAITAVTLLVAATTDAVVAFTFDQASCRRYGHRSLQEFTQPDRRKGFRTIALLSATNSLRRGPSVRRPCIVPLKIVMGRADTEDRATRSGSTFSTQMQPMITAK